MDRYFSAVRAPHVDYDPATLVFGYLLAGESNVVEALALGTW
jgi:hypothetical protein